MNVTLTLLRKKLIHGKRKTVFFMIQLIIVILLFISVTGNISRINYTYALANKFKLQNNIYFFAHNLPNTDPNKYVKEIENRFSAISGNIQQIKAMGEMQVLNYSANLFELIADNNRIGSDAIPALISSSLQEFKLGNKYHIRLASGQSLLIEVIGYIGNHDFCLNFFNGGNNMKLQDLFCQASNTIIITSETISNEDVLFERGKLFLTGTNIHSDELANILNKEYGAFGSFFSYTQLYNNNKNQLYPMLTLQTFIFIILLLMVLINMAGSSLMDTLLRQREYAIYYMLGATWNSIKHVQSLYNMLIISISFLLAFLLIAKISSFADILVTWVNWISCAILLALVYLAVSFLSIRKMRYMDAIDIIRKWD